MHSDVCCLSFLCEMYFWLEDVGGWIGVVVFWILRKEVLVEFYVFFVRETLNPQKWMLKIGGNLLFFRGLFVNCSADFRAPFELTWNELSDELFVITNVTRTKLKILKVEVPGRVSNLERFCMGYVALLFNCFQGSLGL